jgi:hypothetical protein
MPYRIVLLLTVVCGSVFACAQQPTAEPATPAPSAASKPTAPLNPIQKVVLDQFGEGFKVDPAFPAMTADFDGDGIEDLALVAKSKNPMATSAEKNYKVVDPYNSYFGFGNPKYTTKLADFGDGTSHCILVMHDWKVGAPKLKFVIVNFPFNKLTLSKMPMKKKTVAAFSATELGGLNSLVYWDGKKYKWEPNEFTDDSKDALDMK